jgi:hypothetical protein
LELFHPLKDYLSGSLSLRLFASSDCALSERIAQSPFLGQKMVFHVETRFAADDGTSENVRAISSGGDTTVPYHSASLRLCFSMHH